MKIIVRKRGNSLTVIADGKEVTWRNGTRKNTTIGGYFMTAFNRGDKTILIVKKKD
jgi:hypothetical protein